MEVPSCPICMRSFLNYFPIVYRCGHSICIDCSKNEACVKRCPNCRTEHKGMVVKNYSFNEVVEEISKFSNLRKIDKEKIDQLEDENAKYRLQIFTLKMREKRLTRERDHSHGKNEKYMKNIARMSKNLQILKKMIEKVESSGSSEDSSSDQESNETISPMISDSNGVIYIE